MGGWGGGGYPGERLALRRLRWPLGGPDTRTCRGRSRTGAGPGWRGRPRLVGAAAPGARCGRRRVGGAAAAGCKVLTQSPRECGRCLDASKGLGARFARTQPATLGRSSHGRGGDVCRGRLGPGGRAMPVLLPQGTGQKSSVDQGGIICRLCAII